MSALPGPHFPLAELAEQLGLPLVAAPPVFYLRPEQAAQQRLVSAIRLVTTLKNLPGSATAPSGASFFRPNEMQSLSNRTRKRWNELRSWRSAAEWISRWGCRIFRKCPCRAGRPRRSTCAIRPRAGPKRIYGQITPAIRERLDHELEVIGNLGFEPVFLIVEDLLNFARKKNIPTASRGSASSSLVAHCLGITTPDPLALDLYFERFLNPARTTPPDIDTDICSRGRDEVIQHVFDTYGVERVAMVGTINRFRPRSALADVAKAHGLPPEEVRKLANQLPYGFWARRDEDDEEGRPPVASRHSTELKRRNPNQLAMLKMPRRCCACRATYRCIPAGWWSRLDMVTESCARDAFGQSKGSSSPRWISNRSRRWD